MTRLFCFLKSWFTLVLKINIIMKTIQQWLDEYAVSHQNPTNKLIHWICVPAIFWSIIALLYSIPNPFVEITPEDAGWAEGFFAKIVLLLVTLYYGVLSVKL